MSDSYLSSTSTALSMLSYAAFNLYKQPLVEYMFEKYKNVVIFPIEHHDLAVFPEPPAYLQTTEDLEERHGEIIHASQMFAFNAALRDIQASNIASGVFCTTSILVARNIMSACANAENIRFELKLEEFFPEIMCIEFQSN